MATKEEILRELYPEDLFHYADGLTLGEAKVLQETRRLIEKHLRPVINEYWEKPDFPFEEFYAVAKGAQIMNNPKLFEGREGSWKPSELLNLLASMLLWQHSTPFMADFATTQFSWVVMSVNKKNFFQN